MANKLEVTPCVWIHFSGDHDLVVEFQEWCIAEKFYGTGPLASVGPKHLMKTYHPEEAERIVEWFKSKGVEV